MEQYHQLLADKKKIDVRIKQRKKNLRKDFKRINKRIILVLDILVVIIVLFNLGATFTTKMLVAKNTLTSGEELVVYEVNPAMAQQLNIQEHPESKELWKAFQLFALKWAILIFIYTRLRRNMYTEEQLTSLIYVIGFYFVLLGIDFFNDFGYYIGKVVYG